MKLRLLAVLPLAAALVLPAAGAAWSDDAVVKTNSKLVGHEPEGLVVNPVDHTIWVATESGLTGPEDRSKVVIFNSKLQKITERRMPGDAEYAAVDPYLGKAGRIYIANKGVKRGTPVVTVWSGYTYNRVHSLKVPRLVGVAVDNVNHRIFASSKARATGHHGFIYVFRKDYSYVKRVKVGDDPEAIVVNSGSHRLYAANEDDGTVSVLDTRPGHIRVIKTIDLYPGITGQPPSVSEIEPAEADKMAVNTLLNQVYVTDDFNHVFVVNGATNKVIHKIFIPGGKRGTATKEGVVVANNVSVNPETGKIFVASETNFITIVDAMTYAKQKVVIDTAGVPSATTHARLSKIPAEIDAIDTDVALNRVFVTDEMRGTVTRIKFVP